MHYLVIFLRGLGNLKEIVQCRYRFNIKFYSYGIIKFIPIEMLPTNSNF